MAQQDSKKVSSAIRTEERLRARIHEAIERLESRGELIDEASVMREVAPLSDEGVRYLARQGLTGMAIDEDASRRRRN